jgi:ketol-acid reductoisomerase
MSNRVRGGTVAVLGFGNQGEAQALNLRDSGVRVIVGARPGRQAEARARASGFDVFDLPEAAGRANVIAVLIPDEAVAEAWPAIAFEAKDEAAFVFAHGFNLLYAEPSFGARQDVVLVSPTGPGRVLRAVRVAGNHLPAYLAVHRDASGVAWDLADQYAASVGCAPLWRTTVREETEVDLFGEQTVLCGGMNALVRTAFEILVERGYSPAIAYLECVHQLKYLADLLHERGVAGMRRGISGTALYGDLTRGPRVIGPASRMAMREILNEVQSGAFAREWLAEVRAGRPTLAAERRSEDAHPIEAARRQALETDGTRGAGK